MELRRRRLMANNNQKKKKKITRSEKISSLKIFWLSSKAKIERILFSSLSHTTKGITYPTNSVYIYKKWLSLYKSTPLLRSPPRRRRPRSRRYVARVVFEVNSDRWWWFFFRRYIRKKSPLTKIRRERETLWYKKRGKTRGKKMRARVFKSPKKRLVKDKKRIIKADERVDEYFILAFLALDHSSVVRVVS